MKRIIFHFLIALFFMSNYLIAQTVEFEVDTTTVQTLVVNDAYSLPLTQGLEGQVVTSNGAGQSAWASSGAVAEGTTYVYTIPFVCGYQDFGPAPDPENRTLGEYETSILLSNPMRDTAKITRYTVVLDAGDFDPLVPSDTTVEPAMTVVMDTIPRFYSHELDCGDIFDQLGGSALWPAYDGNVIIESDVRIAASGIYTYYLIEIVESSDTLVYQLAQGVGVGLGKGVGVGAGTSIDVVPFEPVSVPPDPLSN